MHAQDSEIGDRVGAAVLALPAEQKAVFILKVYEDMSFPQIAETLKKPVGTVKSQMRLALQKLRTELRSLAEAYDLG